MTTTICAPATPTGGAISVIRISGPQAIESVSNIFSRDLTQAVGYTLHYGTITPQDSTEPLDDVIISVYRAPHSYTGEDSIEISCHGSRYITQRILQALIHQGCRMAKPGEFTRRAFLNGKMDLTQAEAVADLIASHSEATHRMALTQMRGGFSRALEDLRTQLLHLTSLLELELDFSDHEDIEFANRSQLTTLTHTIHDRLTTLANSFQAGNALKQGIPVAIIGAPNVGKSTLLNALLNEEKAIVSDIQGTTRDLIEDTIQIQGITFRFIDTAGIRKTTDRIEQMGIERSIQAARRAQIIILITESGQPFPDIDKLTSHDTNHTPATIIRVINKCDKYLPPTSFKFHRWQNGGTLHISSLTGAGMQQLTDALIYNAHLPHITQGDIVVSNLRHYEALTQALNDIDRVEQGLSHSTPSDLIAEDLRLCLHHLAEITGGEITSDEVLSNIFKHFCIGK